MKLLLSSAITALYFLWAASPVKVSEGILSHGAQPEISADTKGNIHLVFGRNDSIFYSTSSPGKPSFSDPVFVHKVPGMHLGMTRGPQIAASAHYTVITAMDKEGNIHWFLLDQKSGRWENKGLVNDMKGSAPEGLMGLTADDNDHFYAVWLDLRLNRHNNICFSSFTPSEGRWLANKMIYQSPEGHTCECCKPNIAVRGKHVAVMFRNWLNGSRDLYITESFNSGKTFDKAEKLGTGTWKLNGCPMDGGGVTITPGNQVVTVWQREGHIYICRPHQQEVLIDQGRSCSISAAQDHILAAYQQGKEVKFKDISTGILETVGTGSYLKTLALPHQSVLSVWEEENQIHFKKS